MATRESPILLNTFHDFVDYYEMSVDERIGFIINLSHIPFAELAHALATWDREEVQKHLPDSMTPEQLRSAIEITLHTTASAFIRALQEATESGKDIAFENSDGKIISIFGYDIDTSESLSHDTVLIQSSDTDRYENEFLKLLKRNRDTFPSKTSFKRVLADFFPKKV